MRRGKLLNVMPECYVDTNLIEYLLDAGVNHQHCCSKVVSQLKTTFNDSFAIGIIDKDKVELGYISECDEIATTEHLMLLKHREKCQYLITVKPAVDRFVMDCAREQRVDTTSFGLPSSLKEFTKISKSITSNTDPRFKKLFGAIRQNQEILNLKNTLKYLCEETYNSNIEIAKSIFSASCKKSNHQQDICA